MSGVACNPIDPLPTAPTVYVTVAFAEAPGPRLGIDPGITVPHVTGPVKMQVSVMSPMVLVPVFETVKGTENGPVFGARVGSIVGAVLTMSPPGARGWTGFWPQAGGTRAVASVKTATKTRAAGVEMFMTEPRQEGSNRLADALSNVEFGTLGH